MEIEIRIPKEAIDRMNEILDKLGINDEPVPEHIAKEFAKRGALFRQPTIIYHEWEVRTGSDITGRKFHYLHLVKTEFHY